MAEVTVKLSPDAERVLKRECQPALEKIGKDIVSDSKRLCPVYTGDLRSTIRQSSKHDGEVTITAGNRELGIDYALFVEYGTRHMIAQPYLRPAALRKR